MQRMLILCVCVCATSVLRAALPVADRLQVLWDDHVLDTEKTTASRIVHHPE